MILTLLYLAAFFAPMGAKVLSIDMGFFQLSPFRTCVLLLTLLFISSGLSSKQRMSIIPKYNRYSVFFFILWFFYAVLSIIWARDLSNWFRTIYFIGMGVLATIFCSMYITTHKQLRTMLISFQLGIMLQSVIGWYETITRDYRYMMNTSKNIRIYVSGEQRIPMAMSGNPNDFATLLFIGIAVAAVCLFLSEKKKWRYINIAVIINYVVLILYSTSRANILALLIMLLVVFLLLKRKMLIGVFIVAIVFVMLPQTVNYLSETLQFSIDPGGADSGRLNLIKTGFIYLLDTLGFGVGAGQIEYWIANYGTPYSVGRLTNMHNWWMEIMTAYGIWIFIGYAVFYVKLFINFWRKAQDKINSKDKAITIVLSSFLVGYVIASVSSSSMITAESGWVFFAILIAYQGMLRTTILTSRNTQNHIANSRFNIKFRSIQ